MTLHEELLAANTRWSNKTRCQRFTAVQYRETSVLQCRQGRWREIDGCSWCRHGSRRLMTTVTSRCLFHNTVLALQPLTNKRGEGKLKLAVIIKHTQQDPTETTELNVTNIVHFKKKVNLLLHYLHINNARYLTNVADINLNNVSAFKLQQLIPSLLYLCPEPNL